MAAPSSSTQERRYECPGGLTDRIYHGLAYGLCPSCGEFVALVNTGQTVRHYFSGVA